MSMNDTNTFVTTIMRRGEVNIHEEKKKLFKCSQ